VKVEKGESLRLELRHPDEGVADRASDGSARSNRRHFCNGFMSQQDRGNDEHGSTDVTGLYFMLLVVKISSRGTGLKPSSLSCRAILST
jgi:hypothetical protein